MGFGFHSTAEEVTEGLDLTGKTYVVTGATSGLGRETVRVLGLRGARVVATGRSRAAAAETLSELGVDGAGIQLELSERASIDAAVHAIREHGPLDGIIANAGVMALPERQLIDGVEAQFFVNHLAHFRLVTGLTEGLAPRGRVVVVSSGALRMAPECGVELDDLACEAAYDPWTAYGQSKLANLLFARALSRRLPKGQTANALHPGVIQTALGRHVPDPEAMYDKMRRVVKTVGQGAATQVFVATHPRAGLTGRYYSDVKLVPAKHLKATDDTLAEALWEKSEALMGVWPKV